MLLQQAQAVTEAFTPPVTVEMTSGDNPIFRQEVRNLDVIRKFMDIFELYSKAPEANKAIVEKQLLQTLEGNLGALKSLLRHTGLEKSKESTLVFTMQGRHPQIVISYKKPSISISFTLDREYESIQELVDYLNNEYAHVND